MKVLVVGASGRVGRAVVAEALAAGHAVIAVARTPAKLSLPPNAALTVVQGDAYDAVSFDAAVATARPDAVISTLGHVKGSPPDLLRVALRNATDACAKHGVRRLVILGGILWARPGDALPLLWVGIRVIAGFALGAALADSVVALDELAALPAGGVEWTVVRPPMISDGPATAATADDLYVGPASGANWSISVGDVARFLVGELPVGGRHVRQFPVISKK